MSRSLTTKRNKVGIIFTEASKIIPDIFSKVPNVDFGDTHVAQYLAKGIFNLK
jgi:hypothetical protein